MTAQTNTGFETSLSRGYDGKGPLEAVTKIPLGFDRRELRFETSKNAFKPGISCRAKVVQINPDGRSHTFATGRAGDFSKIVAQEDGRATEKQITMLHTKALEQHEAILAEAKAFYSSRTTQP